MGKAVFHVKRYAQRPIYRRRKIHVFINGKDELKEFISGLQHSREVHVYRHQLTLLTDDHIKLWKTHTDLLEKWKQGPENVDNAGEDGKPERHVNKVVTHPETPLEVVRDLSTRVHGVDVANATSPNTAFMHHQIEAHPRFTTNAQHSTNKSNHAIFGSPRDTFGQANNIWTGDGVVDDMREEQTTEDDRDKRIKHLEVSLGRTDAALKVALEELEETKIRLSRLMGQRLTHNNPNITDLSDMNRPTKLAERFSELYDNQWTDAYEVVDDEGDEEITVYRLLSSLMDVYDFCTRSASDQMEMFRNALYIDPITESDILAKQLIDCRKSAAIITGKRLYQDYRAQLSLPEPLAKSTAVEAYLNECFSICWLMRVQDPPVVFAHSTAPGGPFNKGEYRTYTHSGDKIKFVVWPAMLLHEDGPVLCKGVAQGF